MEIYNIQPGNRQRSTQRYQAGYRLINSAISIDDVSLSLFLPLIRPPSTFELARHPTLYGTFIDTLTGKRRSMKINWQAAKSCGINFGMASGRATLCPSRRATEIFGAETARDIVTGRDDMQTDLWGNCFNYCGRNLKAGEIDWSYADIAPSTLLCLLPTALLQLPCSHFPSLPFTTNYLLHIAQSKLRPPQQPDMLRHMAHSCHCECVCVRTECVHFRGRVAKLQAGLRVER